MAAKHIVLTEKNGGMKDLMEKYYNMIYYCAYKILFYFFIKNLFKFFIEFIKFHFAKSIYLFKCFYKYLLHGYNNPKGFYQIYFYYKGERK